MKNGRPQSWLNFGVLLAGEISMALGLIVIVSWYFRDLRVIESLGALIPMKYNAALGFILCGIGLISVGFGRAFLAATAGVAAVVGLMSIYFGIDKPVLDVFMSAESSLSDSALFAGFIMALLLALAIHFGQTARLYEEIKKAKIDLENALHIKSDFLATMSHELRTPLNVIMGNAALVTDGVCGEVNNEQERRLRLIERNANDLLRLVQGVLDITRLERGRMPLHLEEISTENLLDEIVSEFSDIARGKSLRLDLSRNGDLPPIFTDRMKLKEILYNLLGNALKFTQHGKVEIGARYIREEDQIQFFVRDTGIGIRQEDMPYIFDVFHQVDSSNLREFGGTGLGLNIVKKLVEFLQGDIRVESEVGKGSTFYISLPRQILKYRSAPAPASASLH